MQKVSRGWSGIQSSGPNQIPPSPCYCNSRKASGISSAVFPPYSHSLRGLAWHGICDAASRSCEWEGRQTHAHTYIHTHILGSTALILLLSEWFGFRLHFNKGIHSLHPLSAYTHINLLYTLHRLAHSVYLSQETFRRQIQTGLTEKTQQY